VVIREFHSANTEILSQTQAHRLFGLFILDILTRALPFILLLITSTYILNYYESLNQSLEILLIASASLFFSKLGWSFCIGILRVFGKTNWIAFFTGLDWILKLICLLILHFLSALNIHTAFIASLIIGGTINFLQIIYVQRLFRHNINFSSFFQLNFKAKFNEIFREKRFLFINFGMSVSDLIAKDFDIVIISSFLTIEKIGLYKISKSMVYMMWRVIDPFYVSMMPELIKLWAKKDYDFLVTMLNKISNYLFLLALLMITFSYFILSFWSKAMLGVGYEDIEYIFIIMSIWVLICAPFVWAHPLSVAVGYPEYAFFGNLAGLFFGLVSFIGLCEIWGLYGAGFAWTLTISSGFLLTSYLSFLKLKQAKIKSP